MSHFAEIKLNLEGTPNDIFAALMRMSWRGCPGGIKADMIERYSVRKDIFDIGGKTQGKAAHLIVRARHVGSASNDIGLERKADGSWVAHISDFDRGHDAQQGFYGTKWQNTLRCYNAAGKVMGWAGASKWTVLEETNALGQREMTVSVIRS